jgi:hypothetical protein
MQEQLRTNCPMPSSRKADEAVGDVPVLSDAEVHPQVRHAGLEEGLDCVGRYDRRGHVSFGKEIKAAERVDHRAALEEVRAARPPTGDSDACPLPWHRGQRPVRLRHPAPTPMALEVPSERKRGVVRLVIFAFSNGF